jgi:hypothetical protein
MNVTHDTEEVSGVMPEGPARPRHLSAIGTRAGCANPVRAPRHDTAHGAGTGHLDVSSVVASLISSQEGP